MSIFNEYLTGIDRELAIEESAFDTEFSKLQTMYEMCNLQLAQMHKDAELKVLTESGTYDDLTYLIIEAENEVGQQKQGIISRIIDAIGRLFSAIGNKIQSIFGKGDANTEVEGPADTVDKANALITAINNADSGVNKLRNGDASGALDLLKAIKIPAIIAGGAVATNVAIKKFKKGDLDGIVKKVQGSFNKLKSNFYAAKSKILGAKDDSQQDANNKSLSIIQKIGSAVNGFVGTITSAISKAITKVSGGEQKGEETPNNETPVETNNVQTNNEENKPVEQPNQPMSGGARDAIIGFFNASDGKRYRKLKNGTIEEQIKVTNDKGKVKNKYKKVNNPSDELLNATYKTECTDEEIRDFCGCEVIIERFEDYVIVTEVEDSVANNIFGESVDIQESTNVFDDEMKELSDLFELL